MGKLVIVGGGIGGLAAAYWAAQAGVETTLLEVSSRFGGVCHTLDMEGFRMEVGPESFYSQPALGALCADLGLSPQARPQGLQVLQVKDQLWTIPALDLKSGAGLDSLGQLPLSRGARWKLGLERFSGLAAKEESLYEFVQRKLGLEVWPVVQAVAGEDWGPEAKDLSLSAAYPGLLELERQGSLRTGSRKLAPTPPQTFPSGLGALSQALVSTLESQAEGKIRLLARHEALGLDRQGQQWRVHTRQEVFQADAVMVALPGPQAARFFRPTAAQITTSLNQFPHQHSAKVYMALRGPDPPPVPWQKLLLDWGKAQSIEFAPAPQGYPLLCLKFWGEVARFADAELARLASLETEKVFQARPKPLATWVFRHPNARPFFGLGHARRVAQLERDLLPNAGLFLSGGYLAGPDPAQLVEHSKRTVNRALDFLALSPGEIEESLS